MVGRSAARVAGINMHTNPIRDRPSRSQERQRQKSTGCRGTQRYDSWVDDREITGDGDNDPPNHGKATHSSARFLEWVGELDRDVSVDDLGDLYQEYRERRDTGEQADLSGWSE